MRINTNILSLSALRNLSATTKAFSRAMARLASGRRITSARDDAAGLAIAEGLEAQRRGMVQAVRNMNDGKGFLDTAEGALATQTDLVQRMKELAMQAANGTLSNTDRRFLNSELQQLLEEFNRITSQTSFNGVNLLDGSFGTKAFQVGTQKGQTIDVGMANMQASGVFVLRATVGTGTFQTAVTYATGSGPALAKTLADFNGDGHLDALVVDTSLATLDIFYGRGDGTFQTRRTISNSSTVSNAVIVDLNNDGKSDIVTSSVTTGLMGVFIGNGDGTFKTRVTYSSDGTGVRLASGDLNGDGNTDIIHGDGTSSVSIFLGTGSGAFSTRTTMAIGGGLSGLLLADLNADGKLDFVTSENTDHTVSVYMGNGNGTFGTRTTYATPNAGWNYQGISIGDLNGDGKLDLALAAISGSSRTFLYFGNGNGTFQSVGSISAANNATYKDLVDLNGDGFLDIVSSDSDQSTISINLGNGDGSFKTRTVINTGSNWPSAIGRDVNEDGVPDLIYANTNANLFYVGLANTVYQTTNPTVTIATQAAAQNMLSVFDNALTSLNTARANIGGLQNRLGYAESAANTLIENVSASKSQIMDTDFAAETAEITRLQILEAAGVSVLSQANLSFKLVLKLLERV